MELTGVFAAEVYSTGLLPAVLISRVLKRRRILVPLVIRLLLCGFDSDVNREVG